MTWSNKGTYGFIFLKSAIRSKQYDDNLWLIFDYLELESDANINLTAGIMSGYNETWR
jgi:hypothetical protein